jgi:hypothetical protein
MAGGDVSDCVEMSDGYFGFNRFNSGRFGIAFECTGDGVERIWGKDPTVDVSSSVCYLEYLQLSCASGEVGLYDGSDGTLIGGIKVSDVTPNGTPNSVWDFKGDPLMCLTADNTKSICISAADGHVSGFLKVYWGPK